MPKCTVCRIDGAYAINDGHGIFLAYVCGDPKCEKEALKGFRPDIMDSYETDEQIEPEE